jgi:hypothetical protein
MPDAKFYHHGVTFCTQQSHHRMENRDVAAARYKSCGLMALWKYSRQSTTDECMSSTVLRDVLTLFQNGGNEGFDIFILKVLKNTSLFKVYSLDKEVDGKNVNFTPSRWPMQ